MASVVVVGGGVIGCAVAERLTLEGHSVTLLERDQIASHASGAAAGELSPHTGAGVVLPSARESLAMFPALVERIERDSGITVEYHRREALVPALDEAQARGLKTSPGLWLDAAECRRLEPALTTAAIGAVLQDEAHLTPPRFVRALARAAASRGATIREAAPATGFDIDRSAVRTVTTPAGPVACDWVVIAAGPWSRQVAGWAGAGVDVAPQRGQLAALSRATIILSRTVFWSTGYLVPKPDGTVIAGSTHEDAGFDERPTAAGIRELLEFAVKLVPALGDATVERTWAGLRPVTGSGEPIVERVPTLENVVVATGHHRKGLMLAPSAAETVAALIRG
jgi:glycine oxidase